MSLSEVNQEVLNPRPNEPEEDQESEVTIWGREFKRLENHTNEDPKKLGNVKKSYGEGNNRSWVVTDKPFGEDERMWKTRDPE